MFPASIRAQQRKRPILKNAISNRQICRTTKLSMDSSMDNICRGCCGVAELSSKCCLFWLKHIFLACDGGLRVFAPTRESRLSTHYTNLCFGEKLAKQFLIFLFISREGGIYGSTVTVIRRNPSNRTSHLHGNQEENQ